MTNLFQEVDLHFCVSSLHWVRSLFPLYSDMYELSPCFMGTGDRAISRGTGPFGSGIPTGTVANISPDSSPVLKPALPSIQWTPVTIFVRLKRPLLEANHFFFIYCRDKEWSATEALTTGLHSMHKDTFLFGFILLLSWKKNNICWEDVRSRVQKFPAWPTF